MLDCQLLSEVYIELLGGRQTSLELAKLPNNKEDLENKRTVKKYKIHQIHISPKEIRQHKEFVANLDSPVWHKIDY